MDKVRRIKVGPKKKSGDNPITVAVAQRDAQVLQMVTEALKHNEVLMAFQPVMQARAPHGTAFYEGFVRVLDGTGRVIPAREFMPQIENGHLGREIDCKSLALGLQALSENPTVRLSVNMSARSIKYDRWIDTLERALAQDPTLGERLMLEIEERSAMLDPAALTDFIDEFQMHGIAFALGDFGSASIPIAKFHDFFFDAVKLDGQLVRGAHEDSECQETLHTLIHLAKKFDMLVIADKVETATEAEFLVKAGVDCLQGYLFGAPTIRPPWVSAPVAPKRA